MQSFHPDQNQYDWEKLGLWTAAALYTISFVLPYDWHNILGNPNWPVVKFGWKVFWINMMDIGCSRHSLIAWLPHPLFWFAVYKARQNFWRVAFPASALALLASMRTAQVFSERFYYHIGFYCLITSILLVNLITAWQIVNPRSRAAPPR